jgi:NodT family efflux transporter outer membrane factor (OMF) lipoprotein
MKRHRAGRVPAGAPLVVIGLLAAGCAVGPTYRRPEAPMPTRAPALPPEGFKTAQPQDEVLRGRWWEIFADPKLTALEEQIDVSNQNIAQAEAQFRVARAIARGLRGDLFPTVSASAAVTRSTGSKRAGAAAPSAGTVYELSGDVSYEVDLWGRVRRSIEAGVANAQAFAADLETVRLTIHAELASDYFQLRGIDAQSDLLESSIAAYGKALQLTINRHDQGVVSGVDVAQAQTQLETTRAAATELKLARAQLEHAIATLLGKPAQDFSLERLSLAAPPPAVPEVIASQLLERRPDVAAAERRVAAANAQIGVAQAAYYPTLSLSASGGYAGSEIAHLISLPNRFWSIGASLLETLFSGGKRRAAVEQAKAAYDVNVATYRQQVLVAFQEVEDNLTSLSFLTEETAQQGAASEAALRSLALAENRYQGGITSYLEVVIAQTAALASQRSLVELQTRRMTTSVTLVKAVGGGWRESDLPTGWTALSRAPAPPPSAPEKTRAQ